MRNGPRCGVCLDAAAAGLRAAGDAATRARSDSGARRPQALPGWSRVRYSDYICLPSGASLAWTLFGPQATLFHNDARQMMTHFLSPNPDEAGTLRATWQHSVDTSAVWARAIASSSDPGFVAPGAIPWLLLEAVGAEGGPTGGRRLTGATYIHRLNTAGGIAPATGCSQSVDVGSRIFVPDEADYFFYRDQHLND